MNSTCLAVRYRRILNNLTIISSRPYAALKPGAAAAAKIMPAQVTDDQSFIDMDTEKVTKYCCINYLKEGSDTPLKPDSEYPAWLFKLRLGPPPTLDELDPNDLAYWKRYDEFSIKERLNRRNQFYQGGPKIQKWLRDVKKIPEEEYRGDTEPWQKNIYRPE